MLRDPTGAVLPIGGLAATPDGGLAVLSGLRVMRFDAGGRVVLDKPLTYKPVGAQVVPGDVRRVSGMAVDAAGRMYVSDHGLNRVQVFEPDGRLVSIIGRADGAPGDGPGQLEGPTSVAVGSSGTLLVGHRYGIDQYSAGGDFVRRIPVGAFPYALAVDRGGHIFASVDSEGTVVELGATGVRVRSFPRFVEPFGQPTHGAPTALAIDASDRIWVADPDHQEIVRLAAGDRHADVACRGQRDYALSDTRALAVVGGALRVADAMSLLTFEPTRQSLLRCRPAHRRVERIDLRGLRLQRVSSRRIRLKYAAGEAGTLTVTVTRPRAAAGRRFTLPAAAGTHRISLTRPLRRLGLLDRRLTLRVRIRSGVRVSPTRTVRVRAR